MKNVPCLWCLAALPLLAACPPAEDSAKDDGGTSSSSGGSSTSQASSSSSVTGSSSSRGLTYPIVDTAQVVCYDTASAVNCPASGAAFFGQDAQWEGNQPSYTVSGSGKTVRDNVTGLTWQRSPDTNGDGTLNASDKLSFDAAGPHCAALAASNHEGFSDWRLPTIKELYSLIQFRGTDPSGFTGTDTSSLTPFLDQGVFQFAYGKTSEGERIIDSQYASSTVYVVNPGDWGFAKVFGVNFADGRIKGYDVAMPNGSTKTFFVQCVRGNPDYGTNAFRDNGDQTITDDATGLTWSKADSGAALTWQQALAWVQQQNAGNSLGHSDWRLPNAKELQSILDYTRAPDTSGTAALDPIFQVSAFTNETGVADAPWFWTSTTHAASNGMGGSGVYVAFGRAGGWNKATPSASCYSLFDVHGAGAQRSDPKTANNLTVMGTSCGGSTAYGLGPQGDVLRGVNFVRLVRGGAVFTGGGNAPDAGVPDAGGPAPDGGGPGPVPCTVPSDCTAPGACPTELGCQCATTPSGNACIPQCNTAADCPNPPGMTLQCRDGLCVP